jgi:hypothetical protein
LVAALWAVLIWAGGATPRAARAGGGERPTVSAAVKLQVVRLAREGKRAFARKDYVAALGHWRKAYGLWPRPLLLFNIALACDKLDRPAESLTFLREFQREAAGEKLPRALVAAVGKLERELAPRTAVLAVTGPKGARVTLDGRLLGVAPLEVVVRPGRRALEVSLPGRAVVRRELELPAGRDTRLSVEVPPARPLTPAPLPTPAAPGWRRLPLVYCLSTAGLALVLAGVAVGAGLRAVAAYETFQDAPTRPSRDRVVAWRDATNSLWALAGLAGAGAVALAVFTRWRRGPAREADPTARPGVAVDLQGLGFRLSGTF